MSKPEKTFDTVKVFSEIKEKIAKETENMTFQQFKEYLLPSRVSHEQRHKRGGDSAAKLGAAESNSYH